MCRKGVPIYCCNNCSINCLETLFFQGSFSPLAGLRCCLGPFRRPFNWIQCHREGQAFVNIPFHKKAYSDPFRTYGITTSQNVFLNICSSCSHFQHLCEELSARCLWTPSLLDSCLLAPLPNSGCVVTCLSRFAIWSPASFGSWDSGLRVAGRGSLCGWSSVGWLLSRGSLDCRSSGRIRCAKHGSIHRRLQVTAMTVNWYVFGKKN